MDDNQSKIAKSLLLSGLLHDIGKLFVKSRGDTTFQKEFYPKNFADDIKDLKKLVHNHSLTGLGCLVKLTGGDLNDPLTLTRKEEKFYTFLHIDPYVTKAGILLHHFPEKRLNILKKLFPRYSNAYQRYVKNYIQKIDYEHSAISREQKERYTYLHSNPTVLNLLTCIGYDKISTDTAKFIIPAKLSPQNVKDLINYEKTTDTNISLVNEFIDNFKKINNLVLNQKLNFRSYIEILNLLLMKYLFTLPADITEKYPTASLYEHLSSVANLAYTKFLSNINGKDNFKILMADFSGIQQYIFNLGKQTKALKRLKSRSFMVQIFINDIKIYLQERLNLYEINTLLDAGGKFIMIIPNSSNLDEQINKIRKEIEERVYKYFDAKVSINLVVSNDINGDSSIKIITNLIADTYKIQKENKLKPLFTQFFNSENNTWIPDSFISEPNGTKLCETCGLNLTNEKECETCKTNQLIASRLTNLKWVIWEKKNENKRTDLNKTISGLFHNIHFVNKPIDYNINNPIQITLINKIPTAKSKNSSNGFKQTKSFRNLLNMLIDKNCSVSISFLANYVPTDKTQSIKNFDEILDGKSKLAILKGDVDNLGLIFKTGIDKLVRRLKLPEESYRISLQRTLSFQIKIFFNLYINELIKTTPIYKNCYIVYSGGDDFLILGPWDIIIKLAQRLRKDFSKFTNNNPNVTFSSAIHLFKKATPFIDAVEEAENRLSQAKEEENKDNTALFDIVLPNKIFINIDFKEEHKKLKDIPHSLLYQMLEILKEKETNGNDEINNYLKMVILLYKINRIPKKDLQTKLKEIYNQINNDDKYTLRKYIATITYTLYKLREDKNYGTNQK